MVHSTPLLSLIVTAFTLAFLFGMIVNYFNFSPIVGYLLAGVAIGPATPGYVADVQLVNELAEIGVILLMFGVGLHFSWKDLSEVKMIALPGALFQILIATLLGMVLANFVNWPIGSGIIFGLALSVASTVVLLRALEERHLLYTHRGQIAVGWLIVEDIVVVIALVMLPALAELLKTPELSVFSVDIFITLFLTLLKIVLFIAVMMIFGKRIIPWVITVTEKTKSQELFRLSVLTIALGVAYGAAKLFGVSFALGAFFAGMILSESELSQKAAEDTLPLRDAFAVLFFVSIGMLFNPMILFEKPLLIFSTVMIIIFGKSIAAYLIVVSFKYPRSTALTIAVSLAQIGEFSFILAKLGVSLNLLTHMELDVILAGSIISIVLNPLLFYILDKFYRTTNNHTASDN